MRKAILTVCVLATSALALLACVESADAGVCGTRGVVCHQPYVAPAYVAPVQQVTIVKEVVRKILIPVARYLAVPIYGSYAAPPPPPTPPPAPIVTPPAAAKAETTSVASADMKLIMDAFQRIDVNSQRLEARIARLERIAAGSAPAPIVTPSDKAVVKPEDQAKADAKVVNVGKGPVLKAQTLYLIAGKCAKCHDKAVAAKEGKGLVLIDKNTLTTLTDKQKLKIIDRINSTDPARQMPPPKSGLKLEDTDFDILVAYCTE